VVEGGGNGNGTEAEPLEGGTTESFVRPQPEVEKRKELVDTLDSSRMAPLETMGRGIQKWYTTI
jgi:hypothetical protein